MRFKDFLVEVNKVSADGWKGDLDAIKSSLSDVASIIDKLYRKAKPLPGGSDFKYVVHRDSADIDIIIFHDEAKHITPRLAREYTFGAEKQLAKSAPVVGHLRLTRSNHISGAHEVEVVSVIKKYRGQRLGLAMYGIALTVLKLTIASDTSQTKDGIRMWTAIHGIKGVEVRALADVQDIDAEELELTDLPKGSEVYKRDRQYYSIPVTLKDGELTTGMKTDVYTRGGGIRLVARYVG